MYYDVFMYDSNNQVEVSRYCCLTKDEANRIFKMIINDPENEGFDVYLVKLMKVRYSDVD